MNERTTVKPGMPTGRGRGLRRHLLLGTALATSAFIGGYRGYVRRAYAGCTGGGGTYTCGDTTTTTQTLTGTPLVVTTAPGFSIDTTGPGGSAFLLSGTNGLTFTDNNQSTITGAVLGIYARNDGSGALSITATGTVTGRGSYGILARASGNATGVTIEAVDVSGAYSGIGARNDGSGALSITATGTVTGTGSYGIFAVNGSTATDLTIEAADVSGADRGILATNNGSGALSITATGTVTGANGSGIYAVNGTTATDLTIEAVDVSGATRGIDARNYGGVLSITATGMVTGMSDSGIYAVNGNTSTDLTIEAVDVSGATRGIDARNYGRGVLSITATGAVTGTDSDGIFAYALDYTFGLTIEATDVSGANNGIVARNTGSGALSITATGTVTGTSGSGISARNLSTATDMTIDAVDISGGTDGILAINNGSGALSITATGTVTGASGSGIYAVNGNTAADLTIEAVDVSGATRGIDARNYGGVLSITATGMVTGMSDSGIYAVNGNTSTDLTIEAVDVSGATRGIDARNYGRGVLSITATGAVTGTDSDGIFAYALDYTFGLTIEATDVSGANNGIVARNTGSGALSITATGTVTGTSGSGISARNLSTATDMTIDAVDISGGTDGILAINNGSGALSITATGTVTGTDGSGILAINSGSGALSITATGTVTGASGSGIYAVNGNTAADLTIEAVDVSGATRGIDARNYGGVLSITATGMVTGMSDSGIYAVNGNTSTDLTIEAVDVSGATRGIDARNYGRGVLSITATGAVTGTDSDGIFAYALDYTFGLTIEATDVSGANNGIVARNTGSGALSITATGTVTGTSGSGISARNLSTATDMTIDVVDISGGTDGILAINNGSGALSITATGTVTGASGSGIYAVNNSAAADSTTTLLVEDGSTVSGASAGVGLVSTTGRAATVANAGSISGATGVLASGGPATISNTGTIIGITGPAIDLTAAGGPSTVNQKGGAISGDILLSAAANTVNITGGAIAGNIVGQGSAETNFALGSGSFTFAAPFAITGMAEVAMNSGTVAIAGTIDTDMLTVNGGAMSIAGAVNTEAFDLNGGILSVSSDANLGSGSGALDFDGGTFENTAAFVTARDITLNAGGGTFRTDADLTVASAITGPGALIKTGAAALTLNGVNTFTGLAAVNAGELVVGDDTHAAASLAGAVMVNSGGTLGGTGTVGSTTIASGGTIAPGNSIGTLTVKGDITFDAGSTYVAEINPALDSDLIDASGKATIDGGTVYAAKVAGVYTPDSRWTILGADGGVTGTFDTLDQNMPFVDLALAYDADHVYIDATRNAVSFCDVARTFNQCSTGDGVESIGIGNPVYDAVAAIPDEDSAYQALDALSGEIYTSTQSALIEDSHFVRDAVNDRIRSAFGDATGADMPVMAYGEGGPRPAAADSIGPVAWGYAFGSWGSFDGDGNAAAMDTSTGGFLTGIDGEITSDIRLGLLAGYSHSSFDVDGRASSGSSDNYHLGLYGGGKWNAFRLTGGLAYTWHDIETGRSVAFPGFTDSLTGDYNAGTFQAFGEAGYRIDAGTVAFEPFANLAYANLHTDGFTETGGAAALHVDGQTTDTTFTTLGIHISSAFTLGGMKATAHGTLGWRHAFGSVTPISTHAFADGDAFTIAGVPIAKDAALIEAGVDLDLTEAATLGLAYQGQFGDGAMQNGFKADLSVRF